MTAVPSSDTSMACSVSPAKSTKTFDGAADEEQRALAPDERGNEAGVVLDVDDYLERRIQGIHATTR